MTALHHKEDAGGTDSPAGRALTPRAALCVRNYDVEHDYTLSVTVVEGNMVVFDRRYTLSAGQFVAEQRALDPGVYEVRVSLDGVPRARRDIRVGPDPEHTAFVEVGNGAVGLSQGTF